MLQRLVPCANLLPAGECSYLDGWLYMLERFRRRIRVLTRKIGARPVVKLAAGSRGHRGLRIAGGALHCYLFIGGNIDLDLLVQDDQILLKQILKPEMAGDLRLQSRELGLIFERVSNATAFDGDMLLMNVGVHGRGPRY